MKKIITIVSILIISISISACSSKTSNIIKSEETPLLSTIKVKKSITNTYEELDKLPQEYNSELALKNGDVVNGKIKSYNIEKLYRFIETYKNKKADVADMVRITSYTTEGDSIISDLIIDSEGTKLIEDSTRDKFSNTENRKKTEYKIVDIRKINKIEGIFYMAVTDKGEEKFLSFQTNIINDEKTAEDYVKSKGYEITARKGEVHKYTLEKSRLYGAAETIPYQQAWSVQTVEPDKYFGKEIIIYQFIVKNHPLQERDKNAKDGVNVSIMLSEGKIIGGTSYPNAIVYGSCSSIDGKTLEEVTGLSFLQWSEKWKKKYAN
jgi:hypothetical protein